MSNPTDAFLDLVKKQLSANKGVFPGTEGFVVLTPNEIKKEAERSKKLLDGNNKQVVLVMSPGLLSPDEETSLNNLIKDTSAETATRNRVIINAGVPIEDNEYFDSERYSGDLKIQVETKERDAASVISWAFLEFFTISYIANLLDADGNILLDGLEIEDNNELYLTELRLFGGGVEDREEVDDDYISQIELEYVVENQT